MRWSDMDAYRHVNNSAYLAYLEQARVAMFFDRTRSFSQRHGDRAARDRLPAPGRLPPRAAAARAVGRATSAARRSSCATRSSTATLLAARASTTCVTFDFATDRPRRLTDEERDDPARLRRRRRAPTRRVTAPTAADRRTRCASWRRCCAARVDLDPAALVGACGSAPAPADRAGAAAVRGARRRARCVDAAARTGRGADRHRAAPPTLLAWLDGERGRAARRRATPSGAAALPPRSRLAAGRDGARRRRSAPLVRSGALALKDAAAREGVPGAQPRAEVADALLDSIVLTVERRRRHAAPRSPCARCQRADPDGLPAARRPRRTSTSPGAGSGSSAATAPSTSNAPAAGSACSHRGPARAVASSRGGRISAARPRCPAAARRRPAARTRARPRRPAAAPAPSPALSSTVSAAAAVGQAAGRRVEPAAKSASRSSGSVAAQRAAPRGRSCSVEAGSARSASTVSAGPVRRASAARLVRRGEPERRRVARPRQRHPLAVAAAHRCARCAPRSGPAAPRRAGRRSPGPSSSPL